MILNFCYAILQNPSNSTTALKDAYLNVLKASFYNIAWTRITTMQPPQMLIIFTDVVQVSAQIIHPWLKVSLRWKAVNALFII